MTSTTCNQIDKMVKVESNLIYQRRSNYENILQKMEEAEISQQNYLKMAHDQRRQVDQSRQQASQNNEGACGIDQMFRLFCDKFIYRLFAPQVLSDEGRITQQAQTMLKSLFTYWYVF